MNYPKLEIFDIVELRDGRLAVILPTSENPKEENLALYSRVYVSANPQLIRVDEYNDLLYPVGFDDEIADNYVIMKVLKYSRVRAQLQFRYSPYMRMITDIVIRRGLCWDDFKDFNMKERLKPHDWTWVREECKEVTMADIEEKFGCKVKIIKEEV